MTVACGSWGKKLIFVVLWPDMISRLLSTQLCLALVSSRHLLEAGVSCDG